MSSTHTITEEYIQGAINTLLTLVRAEMNKELKRIDRRLKKFEQRINKISSIVEASNKETSKKKKKQKNKSKDKSPQKGFNGTHSNQELCQLIFDNKQSMLDNIKALPIRRYNNVNKLFQTLYNVTLDEFINRNDSEAQNDIIKTDDSEHMIIE